MLDFYGSLLLLLFISILALPFIFLFLAVYFAPAIQIALHPWICRNDPGEFRYRGSALSYFNWWYRMASHKCSMPKKKFRKLWLKASLVYTGGISASIAVFVIIADTFKSSVCMLLLFPLIIVADMAMRTIIEAMMGDPGGK